MKRPPLFITLLGVAFLILLGVGLASDIRSMPPPLDTTCQFEEAEVRKEQPSFPVDAPPSGSGDKTFGRQESPATFEWDQLSPRAGFGLTSSRDAETWARRLGAGWYLDWRVGRRYLAQRPEHWQMVRLARGCVAPSKEAIRWLAAHYPGNVWVIGNEPDNVWQDNVVPEEYAQVYHDLYYLIKDADPTASIAVGGVTQATPLRLAYLDRVLTAYQALYDETMPVDWWTVHGFVLREEAGDWGAGIPAGFLATDSGKLYQKVENGSVDIFEEHVIAFRTWMADRGYQDKPLAITEFGILIDPIYGFTPEVVAVYLWDTFTWLGEARDDQIGYPEDDHRLVQRWAWFSLYDPLYPTSNLANLKADALTEIGQAFREYNLAHRP